MGVKQFAFWGAVSSGILAVALTFYISQVQGHSVAQMFSGDDGEADAEKIDLSVSSIDYVTIAPVNVSEKNGNLWDGIFSDPEFYIDISISPNTRQRVIIDHARSCYAHLSDGRVLQSSPVSDAKPEDTMVYDRVDSQSTLIADVRPYGDDQSWYQVWIKCAVSLPRGSVNRTLVNRRLEISNQTETEMIGKISNDENVDGVEKKYLNEKFKNFYDERTGSVFFRTLNIVDKLKAATSVDINGGKIREETAGNHDRLTGPEDSEEFSLTWDDVRYQQLRDILLVIIGGLVGLSLSLLFEAIRPVEKSRR